MDIVKLLKSAPRNREFEERRHLTTPWSEIKGEHVVLASNDNKTMGDDLVPAAADSTTKRAALFPELHPHPQFARNDYVLLNGWWDFRLDDAGSHEAAAQTCKKASPPSEFNRRILVPYSPEAALSQVEETATPHHVLWYRRTFDLNPKALDNDKRAVLHFEAVDWECSVFVDGKKVGEHTGAYLPFCIDITDALIANSAEHEVIVCAYDPSDSGSQLRGKQVLQPHGMWYTAQSGIWQSVWLETVPSARIAGLCTIAHLDSEQIEVTVLLAGMDESASNTSRTDVTVAVMLNGTSLASATSDSAAAVRLTSDQTSVGTLLDPAPPETLRALTMHIPISDPSPWSPDNPQLYTLTVSFGDDSVHSYCAFRTVSIEHDAEGIARFCLNHRPLFLKGILDQGYWPDGLMTAPTSDALAFDVAFAQAADFNMLRKHIKIESDQWYYFCDAAGMLVWQDIPSGGAGWNENDVCNMPTLFTSRWTMSDGEKNRERLNAADEAYRHEWRDTCVGAIGYLGNHPCIVTWVLFNEGWGQFDSAQFVELVRNIDPTRTIDAASGWFDQGSGDFISEHNYFRSLKLRPHRFKNNAQRAYVISEFGGAALPIPGHTSCDNRYGYGSAQTIDSWRSDLDKLRADAASLEQKGLSGYVLTQLTDVEEETNGLISYDRMIPKYR